MVERLTGDGAPDGAIKEGGHHPEVTVVLPVFRNKESLKELYERLLHVMEPNRIEFEILFVDDASPDHSLDVLKELTETHFGVAVLELERNVGQQRAVMVGLSHARGKYVVVMDADLQDPPEAIPVLLTELRRGSAAVFAGRRGRYESSLRLFTSRRFKRLLHYLCGLPPDAGLFVAMNRQMVERLLAFDDPHPFVVAMIGCTGLPTLSVPVERSDRPLGKSSYSFWKRLKVGCLAIGRVPIWKRRQGLQSPGQRMNDAKVRAYFGHRFAEGGR
jgi:glycosyltransferase involved in cell wall biosynthesis